MSYSPPAPPVDRDVSGVLVGAEQRNAGWMRFLIQEQGRQYPVKADTKKPDLIQQAMSLMGQPVTVAIREQQSQEINPHSGQPYTNRYLNAVAPFGVAPGVTPAPGYAPQAPQPTAMQPAGAWQGYQPPQPPQAQTYQPPQPAQPPQPPFQPGISGYEKDINIMRQCASKCAVMQLPYLPDSQKTIVGLIAAAEAWMAYYVYGPLRFGLTPFSSPDGQAPEMPIAGPQGAPAGLEDASSGACPDCGFVGAHALGCPRGEYQS